ncbi:hypothetical protein CKM354_001150700 [Cercospora kikuchii]|uniref:Protein kinase domain-containing protein n=1 Tax=Cercospora kikuchii TaxID=84275 RepID=A0A9P3CSE1_9PEZI|nr:uncharacterized protein CKM354_001150700 [Cercospora kikuchii]GIZ48447.1 hypothetical protein CKM354_001150700 [Cercospora kikuchii]
MANSASLGPKPHAHLLKTIRRRQSSSTISKAAQIESTSNRPDEENYTLDIIAQSTSTKSLQEFRASPPQLYYPEPSGACAELRLVCHDRKQINPGLTNVMFLVSGGRWAVCRVRLQDSFGRDDWLAAKEAPLSSFDSEEDAFAEYELLKTLDHPHIIATVGAYKKFIGSGRYNVGALLYPLAPENLADRLQTCSEHNDAESKRPGASWQSTSDADKLSPFFACICDALSYLHGLKRPVKHKDIKTKNILIDKTGTVILADFDRAATYDSRDAAISKGPGDRTDQYASSAVMKQEDRSFDRDVAPLGFVFVEMATVVLGETLSHMKDHCKHELWFQRLDAGLLDSWIEYLRKQTHIYPQRIPSDFTRIGDRTLIDKFLDIIKEMAHADINDQGILNKALDFFRKLPAVACEHCNPARLVKVDSRRQKESAANGTPAAKPRGHGNLLVPGTVLDRNNLRPTPMPPAAPVSRATDVQLNIITNGHQAETSKPEIKISTTKSSSEDMSPQAVDIYAAGSDTADISSAESEVTVASLPDTALDLDSIIPQQLASVSPPLATEPDDLDLFESLSPDDTAPRVLRIGSDFSSASKIDGFVVCIKRNSTTPPMLKWRQTIGRDMKGLEVRIVPLYQGRKRRRVVRLWKSNEYLLEKQLSRRARMLFRLGVLRTMLIDND